MQLRNKYYSYPVIVEGGEYYIDNCFSSSVEQQLEGYNVRLAIKADLRDQKMLDMIQDGDLLYAHHVECPQTCFRRLYKTKDDRLDILLKDSDVNGIVQICSFIIAARNIEKYTNDTFAPDYRGWKFDIDKGCVMAVGNQYNIRINKIRDDFANTSSIFSIVKNTDPLADTMGVDLGQQKIVITLPEKLYNQYSSVQEYFEIQPNMHSMIIVPALVYAFSEIKKAKEQLYEFEEYRWFRSLRKACEAINIGLSEDEIDQLDIMKTPQLLLNNPLSKAIEYFAMGGGMTYED